MSRKIISQCKSKTCGAANPNVNNYPFNRLPDDVQKKLKELDLERETIKRCSYCKEIWIEKEDFRNGSIRNQIITVGIDNSVGGGGMCWKILEIN